MILSPDVSSQYGDGQTFYRQVLKLASRLGRCAQSKPECHLPEHYYLVRDSLRDPPPAYVSFATA